MNKVHSAIQSSTDISQPVDQPGVSGTASTTSGNSQPVTLIAATSDDMDTGKGGGISKPTLASPKSYNAKGATDSMSAFYEFCFLCLQQLHQRRESDDLSASIESQNKQTQLYAAADKKTEAATTTQILTWVSFGIGAASTGLSALSVVSSLSQASKALDVGTKATEKALQETTEKVVKETTEQVTKEIMKDVTAQVSEEVAEKVGKDIGERVTKEVVEQIEKETGKKISEETAKKISDMASKQATDLIKSLSANSASGYVLYAVDQLPLDKIDFSKTVSGNLTGINEQLAKTTKTLTKSIEQTVNKQSNWLTKLLNNKLAPQFIQTLSQSGSQIASGTSSLGQAMSQSKQAEGDKIQAEAEITEQSKQSFSSDANELKDYINALQDALKQMQKSMDEGRMAIARV